MEQSDAQMGGQRGKEIRLRKKIADYNHAMQVRCAIAEGKPPLTLKEDMQQIQDATVSEETDEEETDEASCETAADCGEPACCSATEVGTWACNDGACASQRKPCPTGSECAGVPAQCYKTQQVISYNGKYIPVEQISTPVCSDCDGKPHWHANA